MRWIRGSSLQSVTSAIKLMSTFTRLTRIGLLEKVSGDRTSTLPSPPITAAKKYPNGTGLAEVRKRWLMARTLKAAKVVCRAPPLMVEWAKDMPGAFRCGPMMVRAARVKRAHLLREGPATRDVYQYNDPSIRN